MWRKNWLVLLAGLTLILTACSTALGSVELPGLAALRQGTGVATTAPSVAGELAKVAEQAETAVPELDIIQVRRNSSDDLIVNAILNFPPLPELSAEERNLAHLDLLRTSTEAVWEAGLAHMPDSENIILVFMSLRVVNTLDRGPAPTAWEDFGIMSSVEGAAGYLQGPHNLDAFQAYSNSDAVVTAPLNQAYAGKPNHPIRTLEVSS